MSLTTALFTGLTGMDANSKNLDVIGNNVVNANTVGFKSSRGIFETQLSRNLSTGSAPDASFGGTNPDQIGMGVKFAGTQKNFANGVIQVTGIDTDMGIEGDGMFILRRGVGNTYTRAGNFDLDANRNLVSVDGGVVQGFGVDDNFNIVSVLGDVSIPLGTLTIAEATRNVNFSGNFNAAGTISQSGTQVLSQALVSDGGGTPATAATLLTDLRSAAAPGSLLFTGGAPGPEIVSMQGVEKGGKSTGTFTFEVGAANTSGSDANGTTLGDLIDFMNEVMGIHEGVANNSGVTPGIVIADAVLAGSDPNISEGMIVVEGNQGVVNQLTLQTADLTKNEGVGQPFTFTTTRDADGEGVRTSFAVYDSLGTPITVDLHVVLESRDSSGTVWRYYADAQDDTDLDRALEVGPGVGGNGTITFDNFGQLVSVSDPNITIHRTDTGALDPLVVRMNFDAAGESLTALTDVTSTLAAVFQDGSAIGTLDSFSVAENGIINGAFTNGLTRQIGQIALATFSNPEGLTEVGANQFAMGPNSGLPVTVAPRTFGSGRILAGTVELSNVDLSTEFVNLITTSTGFSASSRVITTSDQLLQELLLITR